MVDLVESTQDGITFFYDSKSRFVKKSLPKNLIKKMTAIQITDLACMRLANAETDKVQLRGLILSLIGEIDNLQFEAVKDITAQVDLACLQLCVLEAFCDLAKDAVAKAKSNGSLANFKAGSQLVTYFQGLYISQKKLRGK